jgi:hypothetical protein
MENIVCRCCGEDERIVEKLDWDKSGRERESEREEIKKDTEKHNMSVETKRDVSKVVGFLP